MRKIIVVILLISLLFILTGCLDESVEKYELVSINHMENIQGSGMGLFFIWSVQVGEELNYWCYLKDKNGGISLNQIEYWKITFYEDLEEEEIPYAESDGYVYKIHIPKNSIKKKIDVDINSRENQ